MCLCRLCTEVGWSVCKVREEHGNYIITNPHRQIYIYNIQPQIPSLPSTMGERVALLLYSD